MRTVTAGAWLVLVSGIAACSRAPSEAVRGGEAQAVASRLVIVSDLEGVLEPCGCGDRPAGGIDRLVAAIDALRAQQAPTFVVIAGETYFDARASGESEGSDAAWRTQLLTDALVRIAPDVLVPGAIDRERGGAQLRALAARLPGLRVAKRDTEIELAGVHVAVVADASQASHRARVLIELSPRAEPAVHVVLGRVVVHAGRHGEGFVVVEVPATGSGPALHGDYRALNEGAPRDPTTRKALTQLFARVNALHRELAARDPEASDYVGSEACASCHTPAFYAWRGTAHARAFATLVARGRELDLACVGCHVTGEARTASQLAGLELRRAVGCESCHGPGAAHSANPRAPGAIVREPGATLCARCHDGEHGHAFDYAQRRATLRVPGHGLPVVP